MHLRLQRLNACTDVTVAGNIIFKRLQMFNTSTILLVGVCILEIAAATDQNVVEYIFRIRACKRVYDNKIGTLLDAFKLFKND